MKAFGAPAMTFKTRRVWQSSYAQHGNPSRMRGRDFELCETINLHKYFKKG